jgi:hypothetical protein
MCDPQTAERINLDGPASVWPRFAIMVHGLDHILRTIDPNGHLLTVEIPPGEYPVQPA